MGPFSAALCAIPLHAGTFAYVSAGTYGKALLGLEGAEGGAGVPMWQVRAGRATACACGVSC